MSTRVVSPTSLSLYRTLPMLQLNISSSFGHSIKEASTIQTLPTNPPSTSYTALPTPPPTPPTSRPMTFSTYFTHSISVSKVSSTRLLTLPAELLLGIIAYLPSSSYGPLTQTSHTMKTFFTNYGSRICNQRILTHYPAEATILKASFSATDFMGNTWLVPTHEAALRAEESLWDREGSVSSLRSIHLSEDALALQKRILLSQPGPQFLLFLERRGWEIQAKHSMIQDKSRLILDNNDLRSQGEDKETAKLQMDCYLSWSLERGAVRGFLEELSTFAEGFGNQEQSSEDEAYEKPLRMVRIRIHSKAKTLTAKLGNLGRRKPQSQPERSRLLFGEIPSDSEKSGVSIKETEVNGLSQGLLWYHGRAGVSGYPPPPVEEFYEEIPISHILVEKKHLKRCIKSIVKRASKSGRKIRHAFSKGWNCGNGSFESLD
jgi:hypothetical protein